MSGEVWAIIGVGVTLAGEGGRIVSDPEARRR